VIGDKQHLQQILRNLIGNAVKFSPGATVSVTVRPSSRREATSSYYAFVVDDTGIGISKEALPRIFDSFYQADSGYAKEHKGTGLGLGITKQLVELLGGTIAAESEPGKGSRFTVEIPFAPLEESDPREPVAESPPSLPDVASDEVPRLNVLLAEDNSINRLYLEDFLRREGHTVQTAVNGQEAVDRAKSQRYDVILMDIQMPLLDGVEATRLIREFSKLPIIALTAYAQQKELEHFLAAGMTATVTKPVDERSLRETLRSCSTTAST
jgi:CheY-like chemotaxis protein